MKSVIRGILVCLCGLVYYSPLAAQVDKVSAVPSDSVVGAKTTADDRYRIGFQDVLDVQVDRHADLNQRVPVNANGTIILFRLDRPIVAVCKTERELADDIAAAY